MNTTSRFYSLNAQRLTEQYNALDFESVNQSWKEYWPSKGDSVLDIGAGSGRDAKWMHQQGADVIAVEPNEALRGIGKSVTPECVTWLDDNLPALKNTINLGMRFNVILFKCGVDAPSKRSA